MKRTIKIALALLCSFALLISMSVFVFGSNTEITVTDGYFEFGSYPQTEIVSQAGDSGTYGKSWASENDCIIDEDLYNALNSLSVDAWDSNGDAEVDGNKYRRIKAGDATVSKNDESNFYNWSSTDTYHYFKFEPIRWRVLKQDGNIAFVISATVLDGQMFNRNITGTVTWETCTVRSWLNGYDSSKNEYGTDYSTSNFIDTAFTSEEQSRIETVTVENKDNSKSGTEGGNDTADMIFLLSEEDVYGEIGSEYGFSSNYSDDDSARQAKSSTYAKAMGVESNELGNCFWWLRTPGSYQGLFVLIRDGGNVYRGGQHANSKSRGVRPAMYIDLSEQKNEFTVTFESNGGSEIASQTVTSGDVSEKPSDPTCDGYNFNGWYSDETLTIAFDFSTPITADTTVYAGWTENIDNESTEQEDTESREQDDTDKTSFFRKIINFFKSLFEKIKNLF